MGYIASTSLVAESIDEGLLSQITQAISEAAGTKPKCVHAAIQSRLRNLGWGMEADPFDSAGYSFDALKARVAVEIEFWNHENVFKGWAKLQSLQCRRSHRRGPRRAGCEAELGQRHHQVDRGEPAGLQECVHGSRFGVRRLCSTCSG
jgi:hypothetical protein